MFEPVRLVKLVLFVGLVELVRLVRLVELVILVLLVRFVGFVEKAIGRRKVKNVHYRQIQLRPLGYRRPLKNSPSKDNWNCNLLILLIGIFERLPIQRIAIATY